jgi:hypothetical protein
MTNAQLRCICMPNIAPCWLTWRQRARKLRPCNGAGYEGQHGSVVRCAPARRPHASARGPCQRRERRDNASAPGLVRRGDWPASDTTRGLLVSRASLTGAGNEAARRLAIERIKPGHPQQNGRHERNIAITSCLPHGAACKAPPQHRQNPPRCSARKKFPRNAID